MAKLLFGIFMVLNGNIDYSYGQGFGHVSTELTPNSNSVDFTVTLGWQDTYYLTSDFNFGDGTSISLTSTSCVDCHGNDGDTSIDFELVSNTADYDGSQLYVVGQYTFTHVYSNQGPFTFYYERACRYDIENIQNSDTYLFRLEGTVHFGANNDNDYSPQLSFDTDNIPIIKTVVLGVVEEIDLDPTDGDGDSVTCRKATQAESGLTTSSQSIYTVDSANCKLTIPGLTGNDGDKWAISLMMETSVGDKYPLNFLIEGYSPETLCVLQKCSSLPCNGNNDPHCESVNIWYQNVCIKCQNGYFMKSTDYPCVPCDTLEGCEQCVDYQGCTQCDAPDYQSFYDWQICHISSCQDA